MNRKILQLMSLALSLTVFNACDVADPAPFTPEYVVESYLFALEPLPPLRLSRTVPFDQPYVFQDQAVPNANVQLKLLDASGNTETVFDFLEIERGIYTPADTLHRVLPLRRYALEITFPDDETVLRSQTTVPDTFSVLSASADTVVYLSSAQLEITVTQSFTPGRQNIFVFTTESFDARFEQLTPTYAEFLDAEEDDLEDWRVRESPPVNEENYSLNPDGTLTLDYPWLAVVFYGPNRISASAIDDNIFNFVRSQDIQVNPTTLSPGEIPNVIDPIEGGTGLFGSYARASVDVFVARQ
ncbi:MAG: DUF4249 family protein [Calditrichaeota bacterium]|nr:DUF4249 family protein [Calditrichota bacterium]MCB0295487.1 DUF4249 family protein [Calditrichota bacterium]MCB0306672.1 DUF4249 family protein [Calditrichota bacterium]MCB0312849.1 DUF4249 family protein [Calditrichota bacterium]